MSCRRDNRASRTALFDNLDGIEEGGLRASSSYSRDIDEHENEKSLNSLQDRVVFLKRLTGDIHEEVQSHNRMLDRMGNGMDSARGVMSGTMDKFKMGDLQSPEDLTYEKRKEFLKKHQLPKELPVVSFHTEASISPAVLATLSRVAHAELPTFAANSTATVLPVVVPLGATLAACAQLLQTRYGEKSDGLVTCRDAEVPGSIVVHPKRKLDHAWMVYSSTNDDPLEPDASQVCEALLTLVMEVGLRKKQYLSVKHE